MTHCMKQVHTPTNLLPITVMEEGAAGRGGDSRRRLEEGVGTESATALGMVAPSGQLHITVRWTPQLWTPCHDITHTAPDSS